MPYPSLWPGTETTQIKARLPKPLVDALDAHADGPGHRSRIIHDALTAHLGVA